MVTLRTCEGAEGRLFPPLTWDAGWSLSLQADAAGYACTPRKSYASLEEYETVEGVITGPFPQPVDPAALNLPPKVAEKFTPLDAASGPSIGRFLTRGDVEILRLAIDQACLNPNAGVPCGRIGWAGRDLWHGTSRASAQDILESGVDLSRCEKGYFGKAFYMADEPGLARSSYAGFSEDGADGAVVAATLSDEARILDLRNAIDAETWTRSGLADRLGDDGLPFLARQKGIDGVYDRSFGGVAIYNPRVLDSLRLEMPAADANPAPADPGI
ncbi:hypothetical protein LAZ40_11000 [Cereibacter sphaeroides]|uniref:hypothetical protein n=1 Tax=Cereibacter sphaeroides TaxID=1063 RepID=UPI001F3A3271|nr:hypothetical protein [Cereibacter sphaeroides]MCE6959583.1 hypothetical protein [Cereibacter sphaeroides]MCE6974557.1 hypothetical protein [Cereibacter sphaeroides]